MQQFVGRANMPLSTHPQLFSCICGFNCNVQNFDNDEGKLADIIIVMFVLVMNHLAFCCHDLYYCSL